MQDIILKNADLQANTNIYPLLQQFKNYLQVREITLKSYIVCLNCFIDWIYNNDITQPTRADIIAYKKYLSEPHQRRYRADRNGTRQIITFSAGTQQRYFSAVKMFFKWTAAENLYPNIADNIKTVRINTQQKKRDALEKEDIKNLLQSINRTTPTGKRDFAMILLSVTAGLRIIEMQRANIADLEQKNAEYVLYIQGKGHAEKDAYKKITPEVYEAIQDYLQTRDNVTVQAPLFAGIGNRSGGQRLTEPSISRIIKDRMKNAGYNSHRLSAHSLRHTSVTVLLKAGATLQEAQAHARHANPSTTEIYAHNLDQQKAHTEQRIYNFIFDVEQDPATQLTDCIKKMTATQQEKALELLKAMTI